MWRPELQLAPYDLEDSMVLLLEMRLAAGAIMKDCVWQFEKHTIVNRESLKSFSFKKKSG